MCYPLIFFHKFIQIYLVRRFPITFSLDMKYQIELGRSGTRYWRKFCINIRAKYAKKSKNGDLGKVRRHKILMFKVESEDKLDKETTRELEIKESLLKKAKSWMKRIKHRHPYAKFRFL